MADNVGTIKSVTINGTTFTAAGDVDLSMLASDYEVELIPTSADPVPKFTKRAQAVTGCTMILSGEELEEMRNNANSTLQMTLGFEVMAGHSYQSTGVINLNEWTSQEGRCDVDLLAIKPWAFFKA